MMHISSAGLRVFYQALDELEKANGKIIFCRVDQNIRRVFHVVNFTAEFPLFATLEEATQSIV
jgi:anti-anti-sigma factor